MKSVWKINGSIDGIDNPFIGHIEFGSGSFFSEDGVLRERFMNAGFDEGLAFYGEAFHVEQSMSWNTYYELLKAH